MSAIAESRVQEVATAATEQTFRIDRAQRAFDGCLDPPLAVEAGEPDLNVNLNLCQPVVDERTSSLFGDELMFTIAADESAAPDQAGGPSSDANGEDEGGDERTPAELWLDSMWRANRQMITLTKWRQNGGIAGHAFLRITTDPTLGERSPQSVRLVPLDSSTMRVEYSDDDIDYVTAYVQTWNATDPATGEPIVRRKRTVRGTHVQGESRSGRPNGRLELTTTGDDGQPLPAAWTIIDERAAADAPPDVWELIETNVWPFSWPPIVDTQNRIRANEYWGGPDLDDALIDLQQNINLTLSNGQKAAWNHGHPIPYIIGVDGNQIATVTLRGGSILPIPETEATIGMLEISGDGLAAILDMFTRLKAGFHETGKHPDLSHDALTGIGDLSGLALKILMRPLVQVVRDLRLNYGTAIDTLHARLLEYAGLGTGHETTIQWPSTIPVDELEAAQVAQAKQLVGVSRDTLLAELGYDPEEERELRQPDEDAANQALADAFHKGNLGGDNPPTDTTPEGDGDNGGS